MSAVLQVCGIAALVVGCWLIVPWLAWIVGGLSLVLIGVALEMRRTLPDAGESV